MLVHAFSFVVSCQKGVWDASGSRKFSAGADDRLLSRKQHIHTSRLTRTKFAKAPRELNLAPVRADKCATRHTPSLELGSLCQFRSTSIEIEARANAFGVDPMRCVYLDPGVNLKTKRAIGMTTIKVAHISKAFSPRAFATRSTC